MKLNELLRVTYGNVVLYEEVPGADMLRLSEPCFRDLYDGDAKEVPEGFLQRDIMYIHGGLQGAKEQTIYIHLQA